MSQPGQPDPNTGSPVSATIRIAIVGAESTGKTTLARNLAERLAAAEGARPTRPVRPVLRVAWVPEWLREWCEAQGRTPRADEQAAIATVQHERIASAAAAHDIVVCDTTALMTAVYSRIVFGDRSLDAMALALHRSMTHTLLTAIDLPWSSDGHQRDGPQVREPVDDALRELLHGQGIGYAVVSGQGEQRVAKALAALGMRRPQPAGAGLFTRLAPSSPASRRWICDCCVPEAERALQSLRRRADAAGGKPAQPSDTSPGATP